MGQPQSVQVTSALGVTAPEGQPTMTNCHLLWMWDTEGVDSSAQMALTGRALCGAAEHPCPRGSPSSLHLLHWANWFNRDCWVTNYRAY